MGGCDDDWVVHALELHLNANLSRCFKTWLLSGEVQRIAIRVCN